MEIENLIPIVLSFIIFFNFEYKTSFLKMYSKLLNSKPTQQNKILETLLTYLNYSNEELAFFNTSNKWFPFIYTIFKFVFIVSSIFLTLSFKVTGLFFLFLIFVFPTFIISIPIITIWLKSNDSKKNLMGIKGLGNAILYNFANVILIMFSIALIYLLISILNQGDLIGMFTSSTQNKPLKFDLISGNQLSLAGIFFTLAMGGTIVFSVLKQHREQIRQFDEILFEFKKIYINWIKENKDDKIFSYKNAKAFNVTVNNLRGKLEPREVFKLKEPIFLFDIFIYLILIYYFLGFFTIIYDGLSIDWIFFIGIFYMVPIYIFILFNIFRYYHKSVRNSL